MEAAGWGIILFIIIMLAVGGAVHLSSDFRHFDEVVKQCKKQGFIQNQTTRITCKVEE